MGAQLSAGSGASPGVSSLGSNGLKGGATPRSASERSLALCSSASSSFHSIRLRTLSGSPPLPPPLLHFRDSSAFVDHGFVSPANRNRDTLMMVARGGHKIARADGRCSAREHSRQHGHGASLTRWQSFARALPNLMGKPAGGDPIASGRMGGKRHAGGRGRAEGLDANNNNESSFALHNNHFAPFSAHAKHFTRSPYSGDEEAEEDGRTNFSLKASLKKSGSRIFNSIMRNGYLRALLSDEDTEDEEGEEEGGGRMLDEEEEDRRERWVEEPGQFRPRNLYSYPPEYDNGNSVAGPTSAKPQHIPAKSSLRSSLRNCKRHLQQMGRKATLEGPNEARTDGNGMVSSMLLAMAAGHRNGMPHGDERPLSYSGETGTRMGLDWNGNNCCAEEANGVAQRETGGGLVSPCADALMFSRKKVIQASSTELMRALGCFIGSRCGRVSPPFEPVQLTTWLRSVDRALILQGWQDVAFINPANLVFLFLLVRGSFAHGECLRLRSLDEVHSFVLLCLYISYSYMGNEISYPLKPFITEHTNRANFWSSCVRLIKCHSAQMLRLNSSSAFFLEVFTELKSYSSALPSDSFPC